jgi:lipid A 3-O-deacylase
MKMVQKAVGLSVVLLTGFFTQDVFAEGDQVSFQSSATLCLEDHFNAGFHEASVGGGFEETCITGKGRPIVNYAMGYADIGYFLYNVAGSGVIRGNLEILLEGFGSGIYESTTAGGHYISGASLYLRYNFIQPGWRFIPYLQAGAGLTSMDINHEYDGMNFNFNLGLDAGARFLISRCCSINTEVLFQHISNADLGVHNIGLNSLGPRLSISFLF